MECEETVSYLDIKRNPSLHMCTTKIQVNIHKFLFWIQLIVLYSGLCVAHSPHKAAATSILTWWVATAITQGGQTGSGDFIRSVSTSSALSSGVALEAVLEAEDWPRVGTFKKPYYKPVPLVKIQNINLWDQLFNKYLLPVKACCHLHLPKPDPTLTWLGLDSF